MKRVISSSLNNVSVKHIYVDVEYEYDYPRDITSAKHDDIDIAMFNSFVEDVFYHIEDKGHIIVDGHSSDNPRSLSYYISFYIVEPGTSEIRERYMVHFRLSDHPVYNFYQNSKLHYNNLTNQYRRTVSKAKKPKYSAVNIVVNDSGKSHTFSSYSSAIDFIDARIEDIEKSNN